MAEDVPSPIDLRRMADARAWAEKAGDRPGRARIIGLIADTVAAEAATRGLPAPVVLELGSGPGVLADAILQRVPDARYIALDFSAAMHQLARERLGPAAGSVRFVERSFLDPGWTRGLPPADLVVTNQAVHEVRHVDRVPILHKQVFALLAPGGSYLVSDHVGGPGGLANTALYLTETAQASALTDAGFVPVLRLARQGSLALHRARKPGPDDREVVGTMSDPAGIR